MLSMPFSRQQESPRDSQEAQWHLLPSSCASAQLMHAQEPRSGRLSPSMMTADASGSTMDSCSYGTTSTVFDDATPHSRSGNDAHFQDYSASSSNSVRQGRQGQTSQAPLPLQQQQSPLPTFSLQHGPLWTSTHNGVSDLAQLAQQASGRNLPATDLSDSQLKSTSSSHPFVPQSSNFIGLPDLTQPAYDTQHYYAHYLGSSSSGHDASRFDPAAIPSFLPSMQAQAPCSVFDAFTSVMATSSNPSVTPKSSDLDRSIADSPDSEDNVANYTADKKKSTRRQGVTCDQCRTKHLRCDLDDRRAEAAQSSLPQTAESAVLEMQRSSSSGTAVHNIRCSRCEDKGFVCTKTHAPPSRRYPRPSRSGKRIEQARKLHGASHNDKAFQREDVERINASTILIRALTELRGTEVRITDRVMAGSLSLHLLNCFFAVCHMQAPVIDFGHFSKTFNAANGDPRKMSIMSNGGSEADGIPSVIPSVKGLGSITWPGTNDSKISTPGTTESLLAVIHAWAAHYTDAPIAFGPGFKDGDSTAFRLQEVEENGSVPTLLDAGDHDGSKPSLKRPKRKQGVACDTCRLRRVRCDITERPDGMGCSRCEDKRIKCTDSYIQSKRAKLAAKGTKQSKDGSGEAAWNVDVEGTDTNRLSPRSWISSSSESLIRSYRPGDMEHNLRRGKARKAFCHALLSHALALVDKYDLLKKPSVESIQVLSLLSPLLDSVDGEQAHYFSDVACSHAEKLGMSTKLVVDETDRHAVEHMLGTMQSHRIFLTAWCRDAMASGLNRRRAHFKEERAIQVVGQASLRKSSAPVPSPSQGELVLSGEMGLTFVIMTMVQIGALSRFLATHIDCTEGAKPSIPSWQRPMGSSMAPVPRPARFSSRPSVAELRKLERACGAIWNSLDSLMLFFDRCASKAWTSMNTLQPFRPLGWVASTKLCGSLLYLALFRALGERHRANAAFMATLSHSFGGQGISEEDKAVAASLKALFDKSMQKAIVSCRKTARLIGIMLPLGILQTGGPILKQLFPVAQFLAKIPSVSDEQLASRINSNGRRLSAEGDGSAASSSIFIDPQALQQQQQQQHWVEHVMTQQATQQTESTWTNHNNKERMASAQIDVLHQLEAMHQLNLGAYTHSCKQKEVEALMEGLAQLGYAWDTMDREINVIHELLHAATMSTT